MMNFIKIFNENLNTIKSISTNLYTNIKDLYARQQKKGAASFIELSGIEPIRPDFSDDFQDKSMIATEDGVIRDKCGYTLAYKILPIKFKTDYYTASSHQMQIPNGHAIPGSRFSNIFTDDIGFWGYVVDDGISVDTSFQLDLYEESSINKVQLSTLNDVAINLYIKNSSVSEWQYIGESGGREHSWTFLKSNATALRFDAVTAYLGIYHVQCGLATHVAEGMLRSKWFTFNELHKLIIEHESDMPVGTTLTFDCYLQHPAQTDVLPSGYIPIPDTIEELFDDVGYEQNGEVIPSIVVRYDEGWIADINGTDYPLPSGLYPPPADDMDCWTFTYHDDNFYVTDNNDVEHVVDHGYVPIPPPNVTGWNNVFCNNCFFQAVHGGIGGGAPITVYNESDNISMIGAVQDELNEKDCDYAEELIK